MRARPARPQRPTRERILDAACDVIADSGMDDVRIARIATLAGVSPALVHYHFDTRDALLSQALEHSFELVGDVPMTRRRPLRLDGRPAARVDDRLLPALRRHRASATGSCGSSCGCAPSACLRCGLSPAQLYARYHAWFAETVEEGIVAGEFREADVDAVVSRLIALIDGLGVRALLQDPAMELARARGEIGAAMAEDARRPGGRADRAGGPAVSGLRRRELLRAGAGLALGAGWLGASGCGIGPQEQPVQTVRRARSARSRTATCSSSTGPTT